MTLQNLQARLGSGLPIFVLIDPLPGEPIPVDGIDALSNPDQLAAARKVAWGRSTHFVDLDDRVILIGKYRQPYLVELAGVDDPWLQETLRMSNEERSVSHKNGADGAGLAAHRIGGWIQSPQLPTTLTQTLATMMLLRVKTRVSARYLRLADRRVLDWVRHIVGDRRVCAALPSGLHWQYLAPDGELGSVNGHRCGPVSPLTFAPEEWNRIEAGPVHHATAARWYGTGSDAGPECSKSQPVAGGARWAVIEKAVADAGRAAARHPERFRDVHDMTAWATLALRHTEDDIERVIRSLNELPGSRENTGLSMHSQYGAIESALSDWRK